uniref:aromatic amino acid lyase n=1 Tax=Raoultella terrigena TaxID=577 RepID=UPI00132FFC91
MLILDPVAIDLSILRQLWSGAPSKLSDAALALIDASTAAVSRIVASGETVYGINTGFG